MKIRSGFVSNSSSSSFICDVCGNPQESYDGEGVSSCENDHEICDNCDSSDYIRVDDQYGDPVISKSTCPICTKKVVPDYMKLQYFYDTLGITSKQAADLVRGNIDIHQFFMGVDK